MVLQLSNKKKILSYFIPPSPLKGVPATVKSIRQLLEFPFRGFRGRIKENTTLFHSKNLLFKSKFFVVLFFCIHVLGGIAVSQHRTEEWIQKYLPWQQHLLKRDSVVLQKMPLQQPLSLPGDGLPVLGSLFSPDGRLELVVMHGAEGLAYRVKKDGVEIIRPSALGLAINDGVVMSGGLAIHQQIQDNKLEPIDLLYGEKRHDEVLFHILKLEMTHGSGIPFNVEFRVCNEGIAFQYSFPGAGVPQPLLVQQELTQFNVSASMQAYTEIAYESGYNLTMVGNMSTSLLPLTLTGDQFCLVINEAGNRNYPRCNLSHFGDGSLQTVFSGSPMGVYTPYKLPWRYILVGDSPVDLIGKKHMIYALNEETGFDDVSWIKPGKAFRNLKLDTEGSFRAIDFAARMNFSYVLLDAGWYGLGYGIPNESNPQSDPRLPVAGLDVQAVVSYAAQKNIGIILYVNRVAWYNYPADEVLDLYQSWGVKGIKMGFMDGLSASGIDFVYRIVEKAAARKMIVNVHDNMRTTGLERTYPNLFTMEGIRGNEHKENTGDHTTLLPFTRFLTGAADYTFCYKGYPEDYPLMVKLKTTKAHQLAIATLFYSPLQHIFWSGVPELFQKEVEIEYFKYLHTVWDDFEVLEAEPGQYFSMARKKGEAWFVGAITNSQARQLSIPLDFLDANRSYRAMFFKDDGQNSIIREIWRPDINTEAASYLFQKELGRTGELTMDLLPNGGMVVILTPTDQEDDFPSAIPDPALLAQKPYRRHIANRQLNIVWETSFDQSVTVSVLDLNGVVLRQATRGASESQTLIGLDGLGGRMLVLRIEGARARFVEKLGLFP